MKLHPHAGIRILREEIARLNVARGQLVEVFDDVRFPAGHITQQIRQCDRELGELEEGVMLIETACEAEQGQLPFEADLVLAQVFA